MDVFDDEFIATQRRKYDGKPRSHRLDLHFVATSPNRQALRDWVNDTVARLPSLSQPAISKRLREDRHFITTISELGVASVLLDAGLTPHYETPFDTLTPDWYVGPTDDSPGMIIEVWTQQPRQGDAKRRRGWIGLLDRIAEIPVDVALVIEPSRSGFRPPDPSAAKRLSQELRRWLLRAPRSEGQPFEFEGYRLRVLGPTGVGMRARLAMPGVGGAFDTGKAVQQIKEKSRKYEEVASASGCALAVVLAAEPSEPLDLDLLRSTLRGEQSVSIAIPTAPTDPLLADWSTTLHNNHVPPTFGSALSAIGWVDTRDANAVITMFDLPGANVAFPRLDTPRLSHEDVFKP